MTQAGIADSHVDLFKNKAFAHLVPFRRPGEVRVIYKVVPERSTSM